jgi:hypothetical protein
MRSCNFRKRAVSRTPVGLPKEFRTMLEIYGEGARYCDGMTRRSFLRVGGFTFGSIAALPLAGILRAEAATGRRLSHKALIHIFLAGGPPHQDTFDLKPDAPADIRGPMKPIPTNVDGLQICEVFSQLAKRMDRFTVFRAISGCVDQHDAYQCMSGYKRSDLAAAGGHPAVGSVVSRIQGRVDNAVPAAVGLAAPATERRWSDPGDPGFLGPAYAPFRPFVVGAQPYDHARKIDSSTAGPGLDIIKLRGMTLERLQDRRRLLAALDRTRKEFDSLEVQALDASTQAAMDVLTSSKLADAFDLSKESEKTRERYGDGKPYKYRYDGTPTANDQLLMARRLVEAGVRSVTLSYGRWDSHGQNFDLVRDHGAKLDQCLSALVDDLQDRGMLDDVLVLVWGEFGRTPKINKEAGRDHWPNVNCALLAGGGFRHGQVIGSSTPDGAYIDSDPIHLQRVIATAYRHMGIDSDSVTLEDRTGRPQYLVDEREPIHQIL